MIRFSEERGWLPDTEATVSQKASDQLNVVILEDFKGANKEHPCGTRGQKRIPRLEGTQSSVRPGGQPGNTLHQSHLLLSGRVYLTKAELFGD